MSEEWRPMSMGPTLKDKVRELTAEVASLKARNKELEAEIEGCPINDALMRLEKAESERDEIGKMSRWSRPFGRWRTKVRAKAKTGKAGKARRKSA